MTIRLTEKELLRAKGEQKSLRTAHGILDGELARKLADVSPDWPEAVRANQVFRLKAEYRDKTAPIRNQMRAITAMMESQAQFETRGARLRRAGLEAPMKFTLVVQRATDAGLAQLAADAAADNNFQLAGAIQLEAGARTLTLEHSRAVAEAFAALVFPQSEDLDAKFYRPVRDMYLQCELAALEATDGSATEKLTYAHQLNQPVVTNAA